MPGLLLDTCTERGVVALVDGHTLIEQRELPFGHVHSKYLETYIEKILQDYGIALKKLQYVIAGVGPGSYTGIRVGAIVAKTISYVFQIPLVGVSTLSLFASEFEAPYAAILDAKIGGVYFSKNGGVAEVSPILDLGNKLQDVSILVTPHFETLKPKFDAAYPVQLWKWEEQGPKVLPMAKLGYEAFLRGKSTLDGHLELLYLRKTQAEIEKLR